MSELPGKMNEFNYSFSEEIITLQLHGKTIVFHQNELVMLAGLKGKTEIFIKEDRYLSSYSLSHFVFLITKCRLIQVHRSYFINPNCIREYQHGDEIILMSNSSQVSLSKTFKKSFRNYLNHH